jgi:hypothetical protein
MFEQAAWDALGMALQGPVLHGEHVGGIPAQAPIGQALDHRHLVDDRTSPHVDHEGPRAKQPERGSVYKADGPLGEGKQHHDHVTGCEQLVERPVAGSARSTAAGNVWMSW